MDTGPWVVFVSSLPSENCQLKSLVSNSNFYTSDYCKSPSKQIFSHLEPAHFTSDTQHPPAIDKIQPCGFKTLSRSCPVEGL